jgi:hypothetical protein
MLIQISGKTMTRLLEVVEKAKKVPGAISVSEMIVIYDLVKDSLAADLGLWAVDLGAHAGKSSMIAAAAMSDIERNDFFCMVDLIYDIDNPAWEDTYQGREARKHGIDDVRECIPWPIAKDPLQSLNIIGWFTSVSDLKVDLFGLSSLHFLAKYEGPFSYVFVDTDDHQAELVMAEAKALDEMIAPGGLVLFHDYGNYRGPVAAAQYLFSTGKYEEIGISWAKANKLVEKHNLDEGNDSWAGPHHKYLGCLRRKM